MVRMLKWDFVTLLLVTLFSYTSANLLSVENPDGSYSIGHSSVSAGGISDSIAALLTKAAGWTETSRHYGQGQTFTSTVSQSQSPVDDLVLLFQNSLRTLWNNIRMALRRNNYVVDVLNKVFSILIDYVRYIGGGFFSRLSNRLNSNNYVRNSYIFY